MDFEATENLNNFVLIQKNLNMWHFWLFIDCKLSMIPKMSHNKSVKWLDIVYDRLSPKKEIIVCNIVYRNDKVDA